jgi:hypothetical protein
VRACGQVKALGKPLTGFAHVERQNHPALAQVVHARIGGQRREGLGQQPGLHAVFFQHLVGSKAVEHGIGRRAGQCVAGVRVRMQETAPHLLAPEALVDRFGGQHQRQR